MSKTIDDIHYVMGFSMCGYYKNIKFPLIIDTFSDNYKNDNNEIKIIGNEFDKKIYYPSFLDGNKIIESDDIIIIFNGIELIQRPRKLVDFLVKLRNKHGFKKLFYLQGVSDPYIIPVLVYLGINIFDDLYIREESNKKIKYNVAGKSYVDYNPLKENVDFANNLISSLFDSIKNNTLREVVEKIAISSKALELLRIADSYYYNDFIKYFPSRTPYILANSMESLNRPDLIKYRNDIMEYKKPENRDIALILPCSAKKPYSLSKTHMKIINEISNYRKYLHELIVTSPVGLVPRELENIYPARFYDIPVIGIWYEDEKIMMNNLLKNYLKNNYYNKIIAYIPEDLEFLREVLPEDTVFIEGKVTDNANLEKLKGTLKNMIKKDFNYGNKLYDYKSILSFQFGKWINKYLDNIRIVNNFHQDMILKDKKILFVYNDKIGKFTITKQSAKFFLENNKFNVAIDDFKPTSNVYSVGVKDATDDIKPLDEVILTYNNEVRGVGTAMMPYKAMIDLNKGIAVKVRS